MKAVQGFTAPFSFEHADFSAYQRGITVGGTSPASDILESVYFDYHSHENWDGSGLQTCDNCIRLLHSM